MKKLLILILTFASLFAYPQIAKKTDFGMNYFEYANPNPVNFPVIIFLHGSGERSNTPDLAKIQKWGPAKFLKQAGLSYLEGFTLICPQQITTKWGWVGDVKNTDIDQLLKFIKKTYPGDGRYFVTGLSMGGDGTWDALYGSEIITAGVPVSCKGDYTKAKDIAAKRNIPVWALHGTNDTSVPVSDGLRPVNGLIAGKASPAPIWTLVAGGKHDGSTWDKVYALDNTYYAENIYQWLLKQGVPATPIPPKPKLVTIKMIQHDEYNHQLIFIDSLGNQWKIFDGAGGSTTTSLGSSILLKTD